MGAPIYISSTIGSWDITHKIQIHTLGALPTHLIDKLNYLDFFYITLYGYMNKLSLTPQSKELKLQVLCQAP